MTTDTAPKTASGQGPDAGRALQTTDQQETAVATRPTPAAELGLIEVKGIAGREDQTLERVETTVVIPKDFQYAIPIRGIRSADGGWDNSQAKVGLTIDGYDYLNRVVGASFFFPQWVHDEYGQQTLNPIHRPDYIYLRMGAVWYSPIGQLLMAVEDVEVNFKLLYQEKRANADGAEMQMGDNGPLWDEAGNAVIKLSQAAELKAYKELAHNRAFGPRYAITVGRVRLLKMATGIRSLPGNTTRPFPLQVVGYRDLMTPQQRIAAAGGHDQRLDSMYGRPADIKPLTAAEAAEAGLQEDLDEEATERALVQEAMEAKAEPLEQPVSQTTWSAQEMADFEAGKA